MAGAALFFGRVAFCVLLIIGFDITIIHRDLTSDRVGIQDQIGNLGLLGNRELAGVLIVVLLNLFV